MPFQVAYAVSIHKAQGLEYDSVKIVITDANEDDITHSIFYTVVTRAREKPQDLLDTRDPAGRTNESPTERQPEGRRSSVEPSWPHAGCNTARALSRRQSAVLSSEPENWPREPAGVAPRASLRLSG